MPELGTRSIGVGTLRHDKENSRWINSYSCDGPLEPHPVFTV